MSTVEYQLNMDGLLLTPMMYIDLSSSMHRKTYKP